MVGSVWFRGTESGSDRVRFLHEWVLMPHPSDYEWVSLPAWAGAAGRGFAAGRVAAG